jgi:hypothetical protein
MKKEKDWDYIVKLEKAIAKKYGKEAIQNPAKFWNEEKEKEYLEQLKEDTRQQESQQKDKKEVDGFFISEKLINKETGRSCPTCGIYSFSIRDDVYMSKYECCYNCYIEYIESREERWEKGWRPKNGKK